MPSWGKSHQTAKLQTSLSLRQVEKMKVHQRLSGLVKVWLSKTCLCCGQWPQRSNITIHSTPPARTITCILGHDGLATGPHRLPIPPSHLDETSDCSLTSLYKCRTDKELNHPASTTRILVSGRDMTKRYVSLLSIIQGPLVPVIPYNPCAKVSGSAGRYRRNYRIGAQENFLVQP